MVAALQMAPFPIFLSIVLVVRNQSSQLRSILTHATSSTTDLATMCEIIVVDNASEDDSITTLKQLTAQDGLPNLQVYALTKEVDSRTAAWVGMENALGDFIAVVDPLTDDIAFLRTMLEQAVNGADVVFADNEKKPRQGFAYRAGYFAFNTLYQWFTGVHLAKQAPEYRLLSKRVVSLILQYPVPSVAYHHLPATAGFSRANLTYSSPPRVVAQKRVREGFDRAMRLLVSTTRAPMRLVTSLSLFGAISNLMYSGYVIAIFLLKKDVAPGWVTLSLQQSGMFFLISLVLLVLGEYILQMASLSNEGPRYHVAQEFTSAVMTRRQNLNIEESSSAEGPAKAASARNQAV
jgi:glycosyltransferase involved in cell wall biosynthesis